MLDSFCIGLWMLVVIRVQMCRTEEITRILDDDSNLGHIFYQREGSYFSLLSEITEECVDNLGSPEDSSTGYWVKCKGDEEPGTGIIIFLDEARPDLGVPDQITISAYAPSDVAHELEILINGNIRQITFLPDWQETLLDITDLGVESESEIHILYPTAGVGIIIDKVTVAYFDTTSSPPTPTSEGPTSEGPTSEGPTSEGPTSEGPTSEGQTSEGPTSEGPTSDGPTSEGPTSEGPTSEGPTSEGTTSEGQTSEGPTSEGPTSEGPTSEGPTSEGPTSEGPTSEGPTSQSPATSEGPTSHSPATTDGSTPSGGSSTQETTGSLPTETTNPTTPTSDPPGSTITSNPSPTTDLETSSHSTESTTDESATTENQFNGGASGGLSDAEIALIVVGSVCFAGLFFLFLCVCIRRSGKSSHDPDREGLETTIYLNDNEHRPDYTESYGFATSNPYASNLNVSQETMLGVQNPALSPPPASIYGASALPQTLYTGAGNDSTVLPRLVKKGEGSNYATNF